jgi:hypothetical protein
MIDVEEVSAALRGRSSSALLLAYKFLQPNYSLSLSVKKHDDVDVLIAVVDVAHFTATKTAEGRTMYKMLMKVGASVLLVVSHMTINKLRKATALSMIVVRALVS